MRAMQGISMVAGKAAVTARKGGHRRWCTHRGHPTADANTISHQLHLPTTLCYCPNPCTAVPAGSR